MKKYIPNILTTYRLLVAILIPILFFSENYDMLSILFVIALISDALDGVLARKWNVTSNYGKICDAIGDKLLALSASSTFIISINKYFFVTLILEIVIIVINCINFIKTDSIKKHDFSLHKSSIYGKIKTWFLFISLFLGYISYKFEVLSKTIIPSIILTAIMQVITAITYALKKDDKLIQLNDLKTV